MHRASASSRRPSRYAAAPVILDRSCSVGVRIPISVPCRSIHVATATARSLSSRPSTVPWSSFHP
eukprot:9111620-Lingulodinium_polyedra.AAC.1